MDALLLSDGPPNVILLLCESREANGVFTLLLHKDSVELTGHYHKKSVSSILIISYKRHHLINPADDIDLRVVP